MISLPSSARLPLPALLGAIVIGCSGAEGEGTSSSADDLTASGGAVDPTFASGGRLRVDGPLAVLADGTLVDARMDGEDIVVEHRDAAGALDLAFGTAGQARRRFLEIGYLPGYWNGGRDPIAVRFCGIVVDDASGTIAVSGVSTEARVHGGPASAGFVVLAAPDGKASTYRTTGFDMARTATCDFLRASPWGFDVGFGTAANWTMSARVPANAHASPTELAASVAFGGGLKASLEGTFFLGGEDSVSVAARYGRVEVNVSRPSNGAHRSFIVPIGHGSFERARLGTDGKLRLLFSTRIETWTLDGTVGASTIDLAGLTGPSRALDLTVDASNRTWVIFGPESGGVMDRHRLARFLPDGALDASFANAGVGAVRGTKVGEDVSTTLLPQGAKVIVRSDGPGQGEASYLRLR